MWDWAVQGVPGHGWGWGMLLREGSALHPSLCPGIQPGGAEGEHKSGQQQGEPAGIN